MIRVKYMMVPKDQQEANAPLVLGEGWCEVPPSGGITINEKSMAIAGHHWMTGTAGANEVLVEGQPQHTASLVVYVYDPRNPPIHVLQSLQAARMGSGAAGSGLEGVGA